MEAKGERQKAKGFAHFRLLPQVRRVETDHNIDRTDGSLKTTPEIRRVETRRYTMGRADGS